MSKRMKNTSPRKQDDMTIVIPLPRPRMNWRTPRSTVVESGKVYRRRKQVRSDE